jgi:electron transfer flavoprotein alpha subunit
MTKISPEYASGFEKPRYMFFAADSIGRHLSATVLADLDSGLASDVNKLSINDLEIKHQHKTKGVAIQYDKVLEMYRPDFSGFLWTTILCLDNKNPEIKKEFHPQACSIIPGAFAPLNREPNRKGEIIEYNPIFDDKDLKIKILNRTIIKDKIDFDSHGVVISFGKGIKESPEDNIKLIENLSELTEAEIGISLPLSKKIFQLGERINSKYIIPNRVIGTSGRKITPKIYIAIGISGAVQHVEGMKESEFVIAINTDENAPILDECDVFIKGKMEEVLPILIEEIKRIISPLEVHAKRK